MREAALALGVEEQSVECRAWDAAGGLELVGRATARGSTKHQDAFLLVRACEDTQRGCLARAGGTGNAQDGSALGGGGVQKHPLVTGEPAS